MRQSLSTFSSENPSDGEEGTASEPSPSGTPEVGSTNTDERPDERSDDMCSQGSEIPLPRHFPLQCLVYFPNAEEARHPWVLCEGWQTTPSADCACAGAATGRGQALPRCSSLQQQRAKVGAPC